MTKPRFFRRFKRTNTDFSEENGMLDMTVRVTKSPFHLEQIANLIIHNTGQAVHGRYMRYDVYLDGKQLECVYHYPEDGWATLVAKAITENNLEAT